jgi:CRISPR-associated endonuclease/helicase Cas3
MLHSRFPFFRREELEKKWIDALGKNASHRPSGCVLISTQVAEQSVDIDADLLVTELAPTDMLLQRIGRLWRHEGRARPCPHPEAWITMPALDVDSSRRASAREIRDAFGRSSYVYAPYILLRSLVEWRSRERVVLPGDIRSILEATYADLEEEPSSWKELRETLENERSRMARLAINATTIWHTPVLIDEEGVQTRWNSRPSALVLLVKHSEQLSRTQKRLVLLDGSEIVAGDRKWEFDTAKKVHCNSVRVPLWAVSTVPAESSRWLESYAGPKAVVGRITTKGDIVCEEGSTRAGLAYDPDQGIMIDYKITRGASDEPGG